LIGLVRILRVELGSSLLDDGGKPVRTARRKTSSLLRTGAGSIFSTITWLDWLFKIWANKVSRRRVKSNYEFQYFVLFGSGVLSELDGWMWQFVALSGWSFIPIPNQTQV